VKVPEVVAVYKKGVETDDSNAVAAALTLIRRRSFGYILNDVKPSIVSAPFGSSVISPVPTF
jgi:hypothetical protein